MTLPENLFRGNCVFSLRVASCSRLHTDGPLGTLFPHVPSRGMGRRGRRGNHGGGVGREGPLLGRMSASGRKGERAGSWRAKGRDVVSGGVDSKRPNHGKEMEGTAVIAFLELSGPDLQSSANQRPAGNGSFAVNIRRVGNPDARRTTSRTEPGPGGMEQRHKFQILKLREQRMQQYWRTPTLLVCGALSCLNSRCCLYGVATSSRITRAYKMRTNLGLLPSQCCSEMPINAAAPGPGERESEPLRRGPGRSSFCKSGCRVPLGNWLRLLMSLARRQAGLC